MTNDMAGSNSGNGSGDGHDADEAVLAGQNEGLDEAVGAPREVNAEARQLAEQLAGLEKERDALKDQLLRALAETENVRKRANKQIQDERVYAVLTVDASVASRRSHGGTAPDQVRARVAQAKEDMGQ